MHFLKSLICLTGVTFFLVCNCHGQDQPLKEISYKVDTSIRQQLRQQDFSEVFGTTMSVKWLDNGKEVPIVSNDKTFGYALYFVNHDTISIILSPALSPTAGIVIYLKGNKTAIFHRESSPDNEYVFKHIPAEKKYSSSIRVNGASSKLILASEPDKEELIEGYFEFSSELFYEKGITGDSKRYFIAKGYFRAKRMGQTK